MKKKLFFAIHLFYIIKKDRTPDGDRDDDEGRWGELPQDQDDFADVFGAARTHGPDFSSHS
jgi:hypothetical protein